MSPMKRSKKMFSRFTSLLHTAVEALAPEMSYLEQFRHHWKCVTQFFLDTSDERTSVESTTIPHHMEQMLNVLQEEEQNAGTAGPAMEFMLQHKILETMQTLGRADCPPGMKRQVLLFFTNLLGKTKQQILPHVNVHKPINKLIRCCGEVKAAPTESEEVQFLLQVSSKLKQSSYLASFFLERPATSEGGSSPPLSPGIGRDREQPEYCLVDSLLALTKSEDSRVAIKACEGLLLCTSILEDTAASVIVLYTAFCERMADQLSKLFKGLPAIIDPANLNQLSTTWGFDHEDQHAPSFPGKRQMTAFFSWLDYVNQLSVEAHPMVAKALASSIQERFIVTAIESGLSQASEPCAITVTAILTRCLKLVTSPTLAQEFASILLGNDRNPEVEGHQSPHTLRKLLIHRINHLSDQLAVETLRLFNALLRLACQPIVDTLVMRNFRRRNYLDWRKCSEVESSSRHSSINSGNISEAAYVSQPQQEEMCDNIENTTVETDNISNNIDVLENRTDEQQLENANSEDNKTISIEEKPESSSPVEESLMNLEIGQTIGRDSEPENVDENNTTGPSDTFDIPSGAFNKKKIEKTVNGFLHLLPDNLKTSDMIIESGYDSYLKDAHHQCQQRAGQTFTYDWPSELSDYTEEVSEQPFFIGAFLHTIFLRLQRILDQPYEINLEVTGIISTLCQFRHPYLQEFLFDTSNNVKENVLTPHKILNKVCQEVKSRASRDSTFNNSVVAVRKVLINNPDLNQMPDDPFLEGVIVLEEFCKELAAVAFVKATVDYDNQTS